MRLDVKSVNPDIYSSITAVVALPDGGAVISYFKDNKCHVVRLNNKGKVSILLFTSDTWISGFILVPDDQLVILQYDGILTWIKIKDGKKRDQYKVIVQDLQHGIALDNDKLLLVDCWWCGRVLTFSKSSRKTNNMVVNLNYPTSVDKTLINNETVYVVCERGTSTVKIYNHDWTLQRSVTGDGQVRFTMPVSAIVLPCNTILVSDIYNYCISEFSFDGKVLGYLIKKGDIKEPTKMSFHHPYVWIRFPDDSNDYNVRCYQVYKYNETSLVCTLKNFVFTRGISFLDWFILTVIMASLITFLVLRVVSY